jgi:hypothetical protein
MNDIVFCDVILLSVDNRYEGFEGTCCLCLQGARVNKANLIFASLPSMCFHISKICGNV